MNIEITHISNSEIQENFIYVWVRLFSCSEINEKKQQLLSLTDVRYMHTT